MSFSLESLYAERTKKIKHSDLAEIFRLIEKGDVISFAGGLPDPDLFSLDKIQAVTDEVLRNSPGEALQYCPTPGYTVFREYVARRAAQRGLAAGVENVIITGGSLQALDFLCRLLLEPGDEVFVEAPTYLGAIHTIKTYDAVVTGVPMDNDGLRTDLLAQLLANRKRAGCLPKFIYTIPNFQNPSGCTLTTPRRRELIRLAREYEVPVLEDDAYGELQFDGQPEPLLKTMEPSDLVVFLGTFSKIFCPGVRLGWVIASPELVNKMVLVKQANDQCPNSWGQKVIHAFGQAGLLEQQIAGIAGGLKSRRDVMLQALAEFFPAGTTWTVPGGGYYIWVTLPGQIDTEALLPVAVEQWKAAYVPGPFFFPDRSGANTLRLAYSLAKEPDIAEGIRRLGQMFTAELSTSRAHAAGK